MFCVLSESGLTAEEPASAGGVMFRETADTSTSALPRSAAHS